jgi:hypothetical protein
MPKYAARLAASPASTPPTTMFHGEGNATISGADELPMTPMVMAAHSGVPCFGVHPPAPAFSADGCVGNSFDASEGGVGVMRTP